MSKRILALVCMLALLVGALAFGATAAEDQDGYYDVGYTKADLNPWVQCERISIGIPATQADGSAYTDADTSIVYTTITNPWNPKPSEQWSKAPIVSVPLAGYGNSEERLSKSISDDNGDKMVLPGDGQIVTSAGQVLAGDGVQMTCTSVTDDWGKTVMYITLDAIGAFDGFVSDVRNAIVEELGSNVISASDIMVSGSHSHEAPDLQACRNYATGTAVKAYYDYCVDRATDAAVEAYNNKTPSTMSKGSIEAPAVMKTLGYTYSNGEGMKLNFVRHYKVTETSGSSSYTYYAGDNFGGTVPDEVEQDDTDEFANSTHVEYVNTANETMDILQFTPVDASKGNPTVLVQWQAHASLLGAATRTNVSADYVNALRYRLEQNQTVFGGDTDYNVGFWQGTGGNMNATSRIKTDYVNNRYSSRRVGWPSVSASSVGLALTTSSANSTTSTAHRQYLSGLYGYLLGNVALECLKADNMTPCETGRIRTTQTKLPLTRQKDSAGLIKAAEQWKTAFDAGTISSYPFRYTYNGKTYGINSKFHGNAILTRAKSSATQSNVELNAIVMGNQVALVVAPLELFDHYDSNGSTAYADNDWVELENELGIKPFILSKSNARQGYAANTLAYDYYTDQENTISSTDSATSKMGSYEANTSIHTRGSGEQVVAKLGDMLELAKDGYVTAECPKCGEVEWTPVTAEIASAANFGAGHYYLTADISRIVDTATQKKVAAGETLCINLNGHTMEAQGRNFNVEGELTLLNDTSFPYAGTGGIGRSYTGSNNPSGGFASIASGGVFNLYGGTLEFVKEESSTYSGTGVGGIFSVYGTLNVYGGTIQGGDLVDSATQVYSNGAGGAIYLYANSRLNVSGGEIKSGTVPATVSNSTDGVTKGRGPCVFVGATSAQITLSGDGNVENIYYAYRNGDTLTVDGTYTGTTTLAMGFAISEGVDIGNVKNNARFTKITSVEYNDDLVTHTPTGYYVRASGTNLILSETASDMVATVGSTDYATLQAAVDGYTGENPITLMANITENVVVDEGKDVVLDLNGYNVSNIAVSSGTLYCFDSATADYDVSNGIYGKITTGSGDIQGLPESSALAEDGYLKVNENGALSFHAVNLKITHMTLRPKTNGEAMPSVYYKSNFKADSVVAAKIQRYGIAMNTTGAPTAANLESTCKYSSYTTFAAGAAGNSGNGTLLKGIMKTTNATMINNRNAKVPVYGTAYIYTDDGYMLGATETRTLVQQTQDADAIWDTELTADQKSGMVEMYETYSAVIKTWQLPNLFKYLGLSQ